MGDFSNEVKEIFAIVNEMKRLSHSSETSVALYYVFSLLRNVV